MHPSTGDHFTDLERAALETGRAYIYAGRVIPVIRGGDDPDPPADPPADPPTDPPADPPRMFTEADVTRIVQERLARDRKERPSDDELKQLREAQQRLQEIEQSNKTELEKERERAEAAEKRALEIEAEAKETRLRAAILSEAAKPERKVIDTESVIALLDRSTLEINDQGHPTNIAKAMDSLLEAKPFLVASAGGARGNADQGARGGGAEQLTQRELESMSPEEIVKARKEGRLKSMLGAS